MPDESPTAARPVPWALWGGVAFCAAYTAVIWALGDRLASVPHLPDQGAAWYFWKLAEPTTVTRVVVWSLYAAHQLFSFGVIAWAQRQQLAYTDGLHRVNVIALGGNALFAALHLAQTHVTYDGIAQDVHIVTSLASVAVLLIWVLLMEMPRRGLFFGHSVPTPPGVISWARKYHGYYFSWAIVYTFWFHPAEATAGHLIGFFYLLLIMLQGSLFFTRVHVNRWWTLTLEVLVLAHGAMVAWLQGQGLWPMFAFGFGSIFVVTQVHGVVRQRWARVLVGLAWLAGVALVYSGKPLRSLEQVTRIPIIDYLGVFILAGLFWVGLAVHARLRRVRTA